MTDIKSIISEIGDVTIRDEGTKAAAEQQVASIAAGIGDAEAATAEEAGISKAPREYQLSYAGKAA